MDDTTPSRPSLRHRTPQLDGDQLLAKIPVLAIEAFRAAVPISLPAAPTNQMGAQELDANRRIEAVRPLAGPAGMRALARAFRRRPLPAYQVTARAAMVEALLRGPCRPSDRETANRLLEFPTSHPVWVCLRAYLEVIRCLRDGELPSAVLAAAGDAAQSASRTGDPLRMANALRGLRATLRQAAAERRPAAQPLKANDGGGPDMGSPPRGARGGGSKFLTVPEAAGWLGLGERTVWRRISEGDIHVTHLGSRITRVAIEELEKFAARRGRRRHSE